ncbi:hypothetical protein U9M48_020794 [Paspalum notatum var. saurae]|uniref:Uncharacterized protein n=1 Tax=Paspalum notatum var. saurae TaxID=547442 RepID=A0AAQ3WSE1_PASNO
MPVRSPSAKAGLFHLTRWRQISAGAVEIKGHHTKNCMDFLKWLNKSSKDKVTFIDESLYLDLPTNTWWIDSGATVYVGRDSIRRGSCEEGKEALESPTDSKLKWTPSEIFL